MRKRERSSRPDRPSLERSLDALLDSARRPGGGPVPGGDPGRWQPVAQVLSALTSAPESRELTGEARALAQFRARPRGPGISRGPGRPSRIPRVDHGRTAPLRRTGYLGARPAVVAATGAVLMGGLLAVAYAGDLPAPAQRLAHDTIDAPPAARTAVPDPAGRSRSVTPRPAAANQLSHRSGQARSRPDRLGPARSPRPQAPGSGPDHPSGSPDHASGSPSVSARHRWPSGVRPGSPASSAPSSSAPASSAPASPSPSGSPGGSAAPTPTQQPSAAASVAPL